MTNSNIIPFPGVTRLDLLADRIIEEAEGAELEDAVIVGWDTDGDFYFALNKASGREVLWLLELAKNKLMEIGDE